MATNKKATKKVTKKKTVSKQPNPKTAAEVAVLRQSFKLKQMDDNTVKEWKREQAILKDYEKERPDLAPWIGWEEYVAARNSEGRIKAVGIIGALMRGEKRSEIRKKWRISPGKLNAILNSETVDNVLAYSLGYLYSFQTACVHAILWKIKEEHDGGLALALLEKMGIFRKADKLITPVGGVNGEESKGQNADEVFGVMFAKGDSVQARQAREAIERIVVESFKGESSE